MSISGNRRGRGVLASGLGVALLFIASVGPFRGEEALIAFWFAVALASSFIVGWTRGPVHIPVEVLPALAWITLTTTWSVMPISTVEGVAMAAGLTVFACWLVVGRTLEQLIPIVSTTAKLLIVVSWSEGLLLPSQGLTQEIYEQGALKGPFVHRNILGYVMVVAVLTFAIQMAGSESVRRRLVNGVWLLSALGTVVASRSSTALAVLAVVAMVAVALWIVGNARPGLRRLAVAPLLVAAGGVLWFLTLDLANVTASLGRDSTLTGRTQIWSAVSRAISEQPWTGYGWNALWQAGTPITERMWAQAGFAFYHAHDGYLDVIAQTGLVGLVLLMTVFVAACYRSVRAFLLSPSLTSAWPILCLSIVGAYNITETVMPVHVGWVLTVMISAVLLRRPQQPPTAPDRRPMNLGRANAVGPIHSKVAPR